MSTRPVDRFATARTLLAGSLSVLLLGACASTPLPREYETRVPERAAAPPPPAIYPARGQSEQQLRRDRYECYRWAVAQSGYDPAQSLARVPRPAPRVLPDPPSGVGTATGVVAGAALGAAMSNSRHGAEGAAIGALLGGIVGAASDSARAADARQIERSLEQREARLQGLDARGTGYQRAFEACLDGRGYSVR